MADRNKSELTHKITSLSIGYLDTIGCKPVETEVQVSQGWVADVASYWYPQPFETRKSKVIKKFCDDYEEWKKKPKAVCDHWIRFHGQPLTTLVEVKVTKNDYEKDKDRKLFSQHPPAHLCWLAYPQGIIDEEELIGSDWGLIRCSPDGERILKIVSAPRCMPQHPGDVLDFVAQVGIRRDHRTRKKFIREAWKNYRLENFENKQRTKLSSFIYAFEDRFVKEKPPNFSSLEDALKFHGIKKIPKYLKDHLLKIDEFFSDKKNEDEDKDEKPI